MKAWWIRHHGKDATLELREVAVPQDQLPAAKAYVESGVHIGKVVIRID